MNKTKQITLLFLLGIFFVSCSDEQEVQPSNEEFTLQAKEITIYDQNNLSNSSSFEYSRDGIRKDNVYEYRPAGNTVSIYNLTSDREEYTIRYNDDGFIREFNSLIDGGSFRIIRNVDDYLYYAYITAELKTCTTCEPQIMVILVNNNLNVELLAGFDRDTDEQLIDHNYIFDDKPNPFYKRMHFPEKFLIDTEYLVRVLSKNNIKFSTPASYTYEFDENDFPLNIRAKDNITGEEKLTHEFMY